MSAHAHECQRTWRPRRISRQKFPPKTRILSIPSKPYSFHSVYSAPDGMIFRSFRKRNSSQKNTNTVYSEHSYSGMVPKRTRPEYVLPSGPIQLLMSALLWYNELAINFLFSILCEVEDSIGHGITTPSPMLSALPDSPSPRFNESSALPQSIWSDEIEYVELEKEDRGLGFSILDYKVLWQHSVQIQDSSADVLS